MYTFKNLVIGFLIFNLSTPAFPQEASSPFRPLRELANERPKWHEEFVEFSFFMSRCGSLYGMIAGHFKVNGASEEDKRIFESLSQHARNFQAASIVTAGLASVSNDVIMKRASDQMRFYAQTMSENRRKNGSISGGIITDDLEFCKPLSGQLGEIIRREKAKQN